MAGGGIDIRGIRKVFGAEPGGVVALDKIDLDIKPGEFVSVVGPVRLRKIDAAAHHRRINAGDLRLGRGVRQSGSQAGDGLRHRLSAADFARVAHGR